MGPAYFFLREFDPGRSSSNWGLLSSAVWRAGARIDAEQIYLLNDTIPYFLHTIYDLFARPLTVRWCRPFRDGWRMIPVVRMIRTRLVTLRKEAPYIYQGDRNPLPIVWRIDTKSPDGEYLSRCSRALSF